METTECHKEEESSQTMSSQSALTAIDIAPSDQATTLIAFSKLATSTNNPLTKMDADNFPQGCQFSPDGLCVLTARGHQLELYNTPAIEATNDENDIHPPVLPWSPVLTYAQGGNSVRSYTWYPGMSSSIPETCCFAAVSRDGPVHLFDCYACNEIRATYSPYNRLDELESPKVILFMQQGQQLLTGGFQTDRMLQVFDVARPGRHPLSTLKLGKTKRSKDGQKGMVSAMACEDTMGLVAIGTVSPGSIYLYDVRTYCQAPVAEITMMGNCVVGHGKRSKGGNKRKRFDSTNGDSNDDDDILNFAAAKQHWYHQKVQTGVTQLSFTNDDANKKANYLFSTSRRSNAILQWDLRKLSSSNYCPGVASFSVENDTNQRIEFQVHHNHLYCGGTDGCVRVYDTIRRELVVKHNIAGDEDTVGCDAVNGVSIPADSSTGKAILASAVGSRHFPTEADWENDPPHQAIVDGNVHRLDNGSLQLLALK